MGYWEEMRTLIQKGTDIAVENIRIGAEAAAEKTKEATMITKAKTRIFLKHRELVEVFTDLGELIYNSTDMESPENNISVFTKTEFVELMKKAENLISECETIAGEAGIDEKGYSRKK